MQLRSISSHILVNIDTNVALYWLKNGEKIGGAWCATEPSYSSNKPTNPYLKQNSQIENKPKNITTAKELMRGNVKTLPPETSLVDAKEFIRINRFRHVPIVDIQTNTILGLISDRDLLRESITNSDSFLEWMKEGDQKSKRISDFMTKRILTAQLDDRLEDVARAMLIERIGCILVVDNDHKLSGIITRSDILRLLMTRAPTEIWL